MTQAEFDKLPLFLTKAQVGNAMGLTPRRVDRLVHDGRLTPESVPQYSKGRATTEGNGKSFLFKKTQVAEIAGLSV